MLGEDHSTSTRHTTSHATDQQQLQETHGPAVQAAVRAAGAHLAVPQAVELLALQAQPQAHDQVGDLVVLVELGVVL